MPFLFCFRQWYNFYQLQQQAQTSRFLWQKVSFFDQSRANAMIQVRMRSFYVPGGGGQIKQSPIILRMKPFTMSQARSEPMEAWQLETLGTRLFRQETTHSEETLERREVSVMNGALQSQIRCYDWRAKTEFPIIKIYDYRIVKKDCLKTVLQVRFESFPLVLSDLRELPLFKILFLLKEAIIGFERLFDRFGSFQISPRMVALSRQGKCKIWLNQNYAMNQYYPTQQQQKSFLHLICSLFAEASNKLKNTLAFFNELMQLGSFCQVLNFIENYARQNRISIQSACLIHQRQIVQQREIIADKSRDKKPIPIFNPSLTMNRSPRFLNNSSLRVSLKPNPKINILNLATSKLISEHQTQQKASIMKTSGDTAADIFTSNTLSHSNAVDKQRVEESSIFASQLQGEKAQVPKFNKSDTKFSKIVKANSSKQGFVQTYFSPKHSKKQEQVIPNHFKTQHRVKVNDSDSEAKDLMLSQSVRDVFNRNKWQKTLDGLFSGEQQLKKSTHQGKQKRNNELSSFRLELLGSVGRNIRESIIDEEHILPYTSEF